MTTPSQLERIIRRDRKARQDPTLSAIVTHIADGKEYEALSSLIFFVSPVSFLETAQSLLNEIAGVFPRAAPGLQENILSFLARLAIALESFLPQWNLLPSSYGKAPALSPSDLHVVAQRARELAMDLARVEPGVSATLRSRWRTNETARMKAEGVSDADKRAAEFVGDTPARYIDNMRSAISTSNLHRIAHMRAAGETVSEVSNDYAAFLDHTLYLGASFVTCNPPLIDIAWTSNPSYWNGVADSIISSQPEASPDQLARRMTLEIVYANMQLLRPIFLLTEGQMGYVSLQVNPKRHDDSDAMIRDATEIYSELGDKLGGGLPNVVFKIPATRAGLEATRQLTGRGIGVNITVSFGLFQELPFAKVISRGNSIVSTITHMTGRLAFAVRDELLGKMTELEPLGVTEHIVKEAAAWSGIAVLKKFHRSLKKMRVNTSRVRPLVASLRVYEGESYAGLPSPVPDITEAIGTRIITVFPNVRVAFDRLRLPTLDPCRIETPVPPDALDLLRFSELFKQAYFVEDNVVAEAEEARFRPSRPLTLGDEGDVTDWTPVRNTLGEFCQSYDRFVQRIIERKGMVRAAGPR